MGDAWEPRVVGEPLATNLPWRRCFIFRTHKHDDDLGIVYGIGFTWVYHISGKRKHTARTHTHNLHHSKMTCGSIKRPRCRFGNIFNIFFWMFSNFLPPSELTKSGSTWSQDEPFGLHASLTCRPRYAIQPQACHMIAYLCNLLFLEEMNIFLVDTQFKCILRLIPASLGAFLFDKNMSQFCEDLIPWFPKFFTPPWGLVHVHFLS